MSRRIDQQRAAGRARAKQFTPEYQMENGRRRAQQPSFIEHNQRIAPDGFWAQSAYMRAPCGLRLLLPEQVQFLLPEQLCGPDGKPLTYERQRIFFGLYVWKAIWATLAPRPHMPTDEEFLEDVAYVQGRLHCGMPLENPLHVIYAAPNDWCDSAGDPWSPRQQRRFFRQALSAGREYAEIVVIQWQQQAQAERVSRPRQPGQRRPSAETSPVFLCQGPSSQQHQYGRPDLPAYHAYNLSPQRPYGVPTSSDSSVYWFPMQGEEEEN